MLNRYTPIPPIYASDTTSESDEDVSSNADTDNEKTNDGDTETDEDVRLSDKHYEDIKPQMKKRMFALSKLKTFDNQVRNCSSLYQLRPQRYAINPFTAVPVESLHFVILV